MGELNENAAPTNEVPLVVAVVGPTAVGKSALALALASSFKGEIVSADSRQIYKYMDVGTAKPSAAERAAVPHHLVDFVSPDEPYTLADYQRDAYAAIGGIANRGRLPLLVGGTGLYVRAALGGFAIPHVAPRPELRAQLEHFAAAHGAAALHERLRRADPAAAARIDARNVRRVVRALEVYETTGQPISVQQSRAPRPWRALTLGLTAERPALYRRIDERVDWQMDHGLVAETERLVASGYSCALPAMSSLGYRQICMYLRGELTLAEVVTLIKTRTHRFARQQYTWFRLDDPEIHWFEAGGGAPERAAEFMRAFLSGCGA
ncbi:MAG: tRNA (adenosine(37)-N6)-dimethylallyltransferase MiaA [Chloroflexi bacterium]|nr:tRNA (adenosine(37)-N6)-dimethylallyltransferase MiaA [Chloroflexota bacterium]MCL5108107.1 tRNA (adenosine(37)-N6)-dimethylallyltransferase MiaA [Chloroflexota bacterium]